MKNVLMATVIALIAGLGAGTGFSFMKSPEVVEADSSHVAHPVAPDSSAHEEVAINEPAHDTTTLMDTLDLMMADPHMTPADSLRAVAAGGKGVGKVARKPVDSRSHGPDSAAGSVKAPVTAQAASAEIVQAVINARKDAMSTALPEQRLAKIFNAMQSKDAARVLDQMSDQDIRTVLLLMNDKQVAAILSAMSPTRAATITMGPGKAPGADK